MVGAIILVAREIPQLPRGVSAAKTSCGDSRPEEFKKKTPLACIEVLGRSVLERGVDQMLRSGVNPITFLGDSCFAPVRAEVDQALTNFPVTWGGDAWLGATRILRRHKEPGIDVTFLVRAAAYVELDPLDALQFHRGQRQVVTRAFDEEGPLDIWIIDTARVTEGEDIVATLGESEPAHYAVSGYVNRLEEPRDLRRLVVDSLSSRCRLRPQGSEKRPGV